MRSLGALLAASLCACGVYTSNRTALVPRATPRMTSGQPIPGQGGFVGGASSLAHLGNPKIGDDPNAGVEIPGTQIFAALRGQFRDVTVGLLYENGLEKGAKTLRPNQPSVNYGNVQGYGLSFDYSVQTPNPKLRVGIGLDVMQWQVPWVEFSACADPDPNLCVFESTASWGHDKVMQLAASLAPSYRASDNVALFGNLTLKNHPTIQAKILESELGLFDADVKSGPANLIVAAGAEVGIADNAVLATLMIYYDMSRDPVAYGPGASLFLTVPIGQRGDKQQPPPQPGQPPQFAPPPAAPPPAF